MTCHKVLFGASWLLQLLIQVATPSMTACNEPEGIVDQSISGAWWKKNPLEDGGSFIWHCFQSVQSLLEEVLHFIMAGFALSASSCFFYQHLVNHFLKQSHADSIAQSWWLTMPPRLRWTTPMQFRGDLANTVASLLCARKLEWCDKCVKSEMIFAVHGECGGGNESLLSQCSASQKPWRLALKVFQLHITLESFCFEAAKFTVVLNGQFQFQMCCWMLFFLFSQIGMHF